MKQSKNTITSGLSLIVGAVAGNFATKKTSEMLPIAGKFSGILPVAIGVVLIGQKNPMLKWAGAGMLATGGANVISQFLPVASAPVSDEMISDAIITDNIITEDLTEEIALEEDITGSEEFIVEDLTEEIA